MAQLAAAQASSRLKPRCTRFPLTSARLTVLVAAALMICGVNLSAPDSLLIKAMSADASSTTLLTFGRLAPFSNQFVNQGSTGLDIFPYHPLSALNPAFHGRNPQFVVFHAQNHFVSGLDAQHLPIGSGDDDSAVFIDPHSGFSIHVSHSDKYDILYRNGT